MTIALNVRAQIDGTVSKITDAGQPTLAVRELLSQAIANGTGINAANLHYIDDFSITSSGTQTYDLAGALVDDLGQAAVFTKVKAIMVIADPTNTTNLTFGNATSGLVGPFNAATATVTLKPGNVMLITDFSAAGWTVTAGTGDMLQIANGAGAVATGTIVVIGLS